MGQLTEDMIRKICHFRTETIDAMLADLNAHEEVDAVSASGACSLDIMITELTVSGTKAYTLAAPTRTGQRKIIRCVSAASAPLGTLTIADPDTTTGYVCPATFLFDQAGQDIELVATPGLLWRWVGGSYERFTDAVVAPGACSTSRIQTTLAVDGTDAFTLAAPTRVGQRKIITCVSAANTPAGTLTITSPDDTAGFVCRSTFFFDVAGQEITLEATAGLKWRNVAIKRCGGAANNVVVGTTAITNKMWKRYCLSSTGTVGSTLPNGTCRGEQIQLITTTVGLAGAGTITGTFVGGAGAAYTTLTPFDTVASTTVKGDYALLEWDGTAWCVLDQVGLTLG